MRRAKIVCTLGPATSSTAQIQALVDAGMDVARLNLSHGEYADHELVYARVRKASDQTGRGVAVLVDLQGPKIRLGSFASGPVQLVNGAAFTITTDDVPGDVHEVVARHMTGCRATCGPATACSSTTARWPSSAPRSTDHGW